MGAQALIALIERLALASQKIGDNVVGGQFVVRDSGGLDGDDAAAVVGGAVDGRGVAPGEDDEAGFLEGEVEVVDGLLEVGVGHDSLAKKPR